MSQGRRRSHPIHWARSSGWHRQIAANDSPRLGRIMVVQDDFLLRMETAGDLRGWGYDVVEAFNATEARKALRADRRISLVLLDMNVQGARHGLELARWIRVHHPEMKVLLAAAVAPDADGIPILGKPYRPLDLLQHIDALLKT
jgi:CheY-like chemotaxis protein